MKKATHFIMIFSLVVCLASAGMLYWRHTQDIQSADTFKALSEQVSGMTSANAEALSTSATAAPTETPVHENEAVSSLPETDDPTLLAYRELAQTNPDLVGWLTIEGTVIDYPVMRSPEDADRYLHQDFDGRYNRAGTPFMLPISDPSVPNENIIIYAHHMKNGSMFGQLPIYETKAGYEAQPYIQFDTLYETGRYQIIAVFRTSIGAADEFPYYRYEWLDDEETFDRYMRGVMANRLYDTGETATYGDRLLTLSTCDYHEPNGRLVVVAKLMQETEENTDAQA